MTSSGHSSRWTGTGAAVGGGPLATGSGRGAKLDSSPSIKLTATRISPRAVASL